MNVEFEYKGLWWLPDKPAITISGTLKFTPSEGASLELIGSFKDISNLNTVLTPEIVLGSTSNGKNITLHKCIETHTGFSSSGFLVSSFYAHFVFIGAHFQRNEDIKFKSISAHLSYLDEWVNISGFDIQLNKGEVVIRYELPKAIEATVKDDCNISIVTLATGPTLSIVQKEAIIKQRKCIKIMFSEDRLLDECLKVLSHFQHFLSLGVKKPSYPLTIEAKTEANKTMIEDKAYYPTVEVYYQLQDFTKAVDTVKPFDMLFRYKDISDNFEHFLKNWFRKAELLEPVYNLYFSILYNPHMYLNQTFLNIIRAIESYHRRIMKNYELPEEEHNRRLEEVFSTVLEKHKKWVKRKLKKYSNEPDLKSRFREILDKYSEIIDSFIGDGKSFIDKVVDTRNYLTHYDSRLKEKAAKGEELYHVAHL